MTKSKCLIKGCKFQVEKGLMCWAHYHKLDAPHKQLLKTLDSVRIKIGELEEESLDYVNTLREFIDEKTRPLNQPPKRKKTPVKRKAPQSSWGGKSSSRGYGGK